MSDPAKLEAIDPREAKELYLLDREGEVSEATHQAHHYRLKQFVEWCDESGIDNMNDLTGRDVQRYKMARSGTITNVTLKGQLDTLRVFLRFVESIDGCVDGLAESVNSPSLAYGENRSEDILESDVAEKVLAYLYKYEYASIQHCLLRFLWETGCRMGSARAVDLDDLHLDKAYVTVHHRPAEDTPLKNGERGERVISLSEKTCNILSDYIDVNRHDVEDEFGRDPLFTTEYGRITKNTLRVYIYRVTRPCQYGQVCPHGRDPDECEAMENRMSASKCPDSVAPHAIRRGAITHFLSQDVPGKVISDRMNVGQDVIDEHYDSRSEREKMEMRRDHLDNI